MNFSRLPERPNVPPILQNLKTARPRKKRPTSAGPKYLPKIKIIKYCVAAFKSLPKNTMVEPEYILCKSLVIGLKKRFYLP